MVDDWKRKIMDTVAIELSKVVDNLPRRLSVVKL